MNGATVLRTPWFYGWTIVGVCVVVQILTIGMYAVFSFFVRPWAEEFGASRAELMMAIALAHIGKMMWGLIFGPLMDRASIRVIIAAGLGVMALGFVGMSVAGSAWQVIAIFALAAGLGMSMAGPLAGQTLAARWFRARRGLALGIVPMGSLFSGLVLVPITIALLHQFGWRGAFLGFAALFAAMIPLVVFLVRNGPEEAGVAPDRSAEGETAVKAAVSAPQWTIREILTNRNFWIAGLVFVGPTLTIGAFSANLEPFAHDLGIPIHKTAIVAQVLSLMGIVGVLWGRLSDRIDHRILVLASFATQVVGYLLLLGEPSYLRLLVAAMVIAAGMSSFYPLVSAIITRCFGAANFGRVLGFILTFYVTGAVGSPVAGWVRDRFGTYEPFFLTMAIVIASLGLLVVLLRPPTAARSRTYTVEGVPGA